MLNYTQINSYQQTGGSRFALLRVVFVPVLPVDSDSSWYGRYPPVAVSNATREIAVLVTPCCMLKREAWPIAVPNSEALIATLSGKVFLNVHIPASKCVIFHPSFARLSLAASVSQRLNSTCSLNAEILLSLQLREMDCLLSINNNCMWAGEACVFK